MPTYQYACTACGHRFEVVQSFSDEPLTECSVCSGRLRKLFSSVGVVFKGSGFYRTDSRERGKDGAGNDRSDRGDRKEKADAPAGGASPNGSAKNGSSTEGSSASSDSSSSTSSTGAASSSSGSSGSRSSGSGSTSAGT